MRAQHPLSLLEEALSPMWPGRRGEGAESGGCLQPGDSAQLTGAGAWREGCPSLVGSLGPLVPPCCVASSGMPSSPTAQDP